MKKNPSGAFIFLSHIPNPFVDKAKNVFLIKRDCIFAQISIKSPNEEVSEIFCSDSLSVLLLHPHKLKFGATFLGGWKMKSGNSSTSGK
jgi:hypothetical protein